MNNPFARWLALAAAVAFLWLFRQNQPAIKPSPELRRVMDLARKHRS